MTHTVHRLSGIVTPASAAYSVSELEHQLRSSGANALITCIPLLDVALAAAKSVGILHDRIFILSVPGSDKKAPFKTIDDLVEEGRNLPELQPLNWAPGQGARQVAFLSFSSGTSGLPVSCPPSKIYSFTDGIYRKPLKSVTSMLYQTSFRSASTTRLVAMPLELVPWLAWASFPSRIFMVLWWLPIVVSCLSRPDDCSRKM